MRHLKLGEPLYRTAAVDSTMRWAREQVERGLVGPGAAFVAGAQTAGRGRHGRTWISLPGKGLYLTIVLPETVATPALTLAGAVAVAEAAERTCGVSARIKWPNDLLAGDRKWGGVLAEQVSGEGATAVLLGVGVNVSHGAHDLEGELARTATSLALASGRPVDAESLLRNILERLKERLVAFEREGFTAVAEPYRQRAVLMPGDKLEIEQTGRPKWLGTFRGLDGEGRLVVDESPQPLASGIVLSVRGGNSA